MNVSPRGCYRASRPHTGERCRGENAGRAASDGVRSLVQDILTDGWPCFGLWVPKTRSQRNANENARRLPERVEDAERQVYGPRAWVPSSLLCSRAWPSSFAPGWPCRSKFSRYDTSSPSTKEQAGGHDSSQPIVSCGCGYRGLGLNGGEPLSSCARTRLSLGNANASETTGRS